MALTLVLPEPVPGLQDVVETDPVRLREWLIALPSAQVLEAGRRILDPLSALNRVVLDMTTRAALLEQYQVALELLIGGFEAAYSTSGLPLRDEARQAALLARNLWQELALGWKLVLVDRLEKRSLFGSVNKMVPVYMVRVLEAYWQLYLVCSRLYTALPEGVWSELHQMFWHAADGRYMDEPNSPPSPTISILYKRFLLLALVDPQRFAPSEFERVLDIIISYGHHAHFCTPDKLQTAAGYFLVELDRDQPPRYVGKREERTIHESAILLDTNDLSRTLHRLELAAEAKKVEPGYREKMQEKLELIRRTMMQWSIAPQRVFQRIPESGLVDVLLNLGEVVSKLRGTVAPEISADANLLVDEKKSYSRWQILNESPGGYAVRSVYVPDESVAAGHVVALKPSGTKKWLVASVRWVQQAEDNCIEMGLQVLSAEPIPVALSPVVGGTGIAAPDAILLPELPVLFVPARLLAPKGFYTPLREIHMQTADGQEQLVRMGKLVEQQAAYDLFEFQVLDGN